MFAQCSNEECLPMEAVTKQRDCICDSYLWSAVTSCVLKCPMNPITNSSLSIYATR
jgi:hypothetical protein